MNPEISVCAETLAGAAQELRSILRTLNQLGGRFASARTAALEADLHLRALGLAPRVSSGQPSTPDGGYSDDFDGKELQRASALLAEVYRLRVELHDAFGVPMMDLEEDMGRIDALENSGA